MKKALKITGITLGCLLGLVVIAAIVALTTVTSPKRLTKLVRKYVPQYVNFDMSLQQAHLTLKTFPDVGLEIDDVAILSPMDNAPSDTLARIGKLILSANARKFIKENEIVVNRCIIDNAMVNLFTDAEGHSNLDIFSSDNPDTTNQPFNYSLDLKQVELNNTNISYIDQSSNLNAQATGLDLNVTGNFKDQLITAGLTNSVATLSFATPDLTIALADLNLRFDGTLNDFNNLNGTLHLATPDISLNAGYPVLNHERIDLELPLALNINPLNAHLNDTKVALNDYLIHLQGNAAMDDSGDTDIDLAFSTNTLDIEDLMHYLPDNVAQSLNGIQFKGKIDLTDGKVKGILNDSLMPLITAQVNASDAVVRIPELPYPFTKVELSTLMHLDLNDSINARDIQLSAMMNKTKINVTGQLNDLADHMALDLKLKSNLVMTDLKSFLPKNTLLKGRANVNMTLKSSLDDFLSTVTDLKFNKRLRADATVSMSDFSFDMDSIHAQSPQMNIDLTLPASRKVKGRTGAYIGLKTDDLDFNMGKAMRAELNDLQLTAAADHLNGAVEQMLAQAELSLSKLDFVYDTIHVNANRPIIGLETTPQKNKGLNLRASFNGNDINANAGVAYVLNTHALKVSGSANENKGKTDFLNRWNPSADFTLDNAELRLAGLDEKIIIPTIDFLFNSHELGFKKGTVKIGKSDMTLEGNVIGINKWIEDQNNLMKADFQLTSNYLDINEIMDLTSGLGVKEDKADEEMVSKDDNPFMVPEGIDFNFGIRAKKALYGNFDLNDLGGTATIKDGTLLLREIGFTNEAAEMQLTAMYQSPRKNHLFLGLDFHLLNVQIYDLLHMIPEIDTIVPMLKTFDGAAEFHIAAQTNLKSNYEPKMSTLRASADIEGADLRVKDIVTFTKITDMLKVSTNGEYRIDSLDIQMTAFRNEVDLWPFQIALGKYKATVDGHYNLNTIGEYHISVTDSPLPTRLGLKISGPLNNLTYSLESCKYPYLYRPERRSDTEQMVMDLKKMIANKLKENVL